MLGWNRVAWSGGASTRLLLGLEWHYLGRGDKAVRLRLASGVYAEASLSWAGFKFYSFMFQKPANQPKLKT